MISRISMISRDAIEIIDIKDFEGIKVTKKYQRISVLLRISRDIRDV